MFLRQILSGLVQREMQGRVLGALQGAARDAVSGVPQEQTGPESELPATPPRVAILFALGLEASGTEQALVNSCPARGTHVSGQTGWLARRHVFVGHTGMAGAHSATLAAEEIIAALSPNWLISAGFAGGLREPLRRGHMVLVNRVGQESGPDLEIGLTMENANTEGSFGPHVGKLLTVDRLIRTREEKRSLGECHGALACDMETWPVAQVCRRTKTGFLAARIISDAVDDELPPEIERLMNQKSFAGQLGAAAGALWRRPAVAKDLWRLQEEAQKSSARLARFLAGMVAQLPES